MPVTFPAARRIVLDLLTVGRPIRHLEEGPSRPSFKGNVIWMAAGIANIVRVTAAGICLFVLLMLSAGSAVAHVGGHSRQSVTATFTLSLIAEASASERPSGQPPSRECPGGMDCCAQGQCPLQDARLGSGTAFDFEYRNGRDGYPEHFSFGLTGIAALPSTPPPRLST